MDDRDRLIRKADAAVIGGERRIVPFLDLPQEDAGDGVGS